jgi:hypothetical protein
MNIRTQNKEEYRVRIIQNHGTAMPDVYSETRIFRRRVEERLVAAGMRCLLYATRKGTTKNKVTTRNEEVGQTDERRKNCRHQREIPS